jgi:hypothetical protein
LRTSHPLKTPKNVFVGASIKVQTFHEFFSIDFITLRFIYTAHYIGAILHCVFAL